ncbi:MAG: hypothetical protein PHE88_04900 [Elusimicrobia bacterium]|nr:hypothetical protein [Elusimicrobiota bacterium]
MRIKHPKCQVFLYNEKEPLNIFDLKGLVAVAISSSEEKKNIEFIKISGFDENNKKISIRLDFGSMTTDVNKAEDEQSDEDSKISKLFGEILLQLNYITKEQLEECLSLQTESHYNKKLGEVLVERGFIEPNKVLDVLSRQIGVSYLKKQFRSKK